MKLDFDTGPARRAQAREDARKNREAQLQQWHKWFAWWPVRVGPSDHRWLEFVERREIPVLKNFYFSYYRPLVREKQKRLTEFRAI